MSTKKIIVILLALMVVGLVIYVLLRGGSSSKPTVPTGETGSLPIVGSTTVSLPSFFAEGSASGTSAGAVSIIGAGPVAAYFVGTSSTVTIAQTNGAIVVFSGDQTAPLSSSSISNLVAAGFSYDGKKIVTSSGSANNPQTEIFDVATRSWTSLGMGIMSPAWAPSDERLAYLRDAGNGALTVMTIDFTKPKPVAIVLGTFSLQDMQLTWIDANNLALVSRPSAYANGSALLFNIVKKTLTPIVVDRPGLEAAWNAAKSNSMGLVFSAGQSERGGRLQLVNMQGDILQNISFITLPTKCAFAAVSAQASSSISAAGLATSTVIATTTSVASKTTSTASSSLSTSNIQHPTTSLFCAVPRDQTTLSYYDLPDAYEQHRIFTSDDLYRVNITTGHVDTLFGDGTQNFDMTDVSVVGQSFFFVNRYDQKLYAVKIQ